MPVKLYSRGDRTAIVTGHALLYGDDDSAVSPLTAETDYMLSLVPEKPVLFEHNIRDARGVIEGPIGLVEHEIKTEMGIFVSATLDLSVPGVKALLPEIEQGLIGWSAGPLLGLVKRRTGLVERFPIVEYSLTRYPRDKRQLGKANKPFAPFSMFFHKQGILIHIESGTPASWDQVTAACKSGNSVRIICDDETLAQPSGFRRQITYIKG